MIWFLNLAVCLAAAALLVQQHKRIQNMEQRLVCLEQGVVPGHAQAKAAAAAVDEFHAGIAGILGYDPYDAKKAAKE